MRLGLGPIDLRDAAGARLRDLAEAATAATFDCVWLAENRGAGSGGALAAATMVAQWTPVRVGAVVDFGAYHPLHLAEDVAVADVASGGRIEVVLRAAHDDPDVIKEHLHVLAAALAGAHIQWEGLRLRIPARLADNGPVPQRLAVSPPPVQPVVPAWILDPEEPWATVAERLGFGVAQGFHAGMAVGPPRSRLPRLLLCPGHVEAAELLAAAGDDAGYFVVAASTPEEVRSAGRRLVGPLRMPEFPDWVHARR